MKAKLHCSEMLVESSPSSDFVTLDKLTLIPSFVALTFVGLDLAKIVNFQIPRNEHVPLLEGSNDFTVGSAASSSCIVGDITFAAIVQIWGQPSGVKAS